MKKLRRSERLVDISKLFLDQPNTLFSLSFFADRYQSAKSSISEDIAIISEMFKKDGTGQLITYSGAAGGVKYVPMISDEETNVVINDLCQLLSAGERLLPGGYIYMLDILGNPKLMKKIGKIFSSAFSNLGIDTIVTIETKGIPLAYATAYFLNVPVVIVNKNSKITEGSVVTINYVSGSTNRIQTMSLAKRAIKENANVLVIDDLMKAGGTVLGIVNLLREFGANVKGIGVFAEVDHPHERLVNEYISLVRILEVNEREKKAKVISGGISNKMQIINQNVSKL